MSKAECATALETSLCWGKHLRDFGSFYGFFINHLVIYHVMESLPCPSIPGLYEAMGYVIDVGASPTHSLLGYTCG